MAIQINAVKEKLYKISVSSSSSQDEVLLVLPGNIIQASLYQCNHRKSTFTNLQIKLKRHNNSISAGIHDGKKYLRNEEARLSAITNIFMPSGAISYSA